MRSYRLVTVAALALVTGAAAHADFLNYYIGRDQRTTIPSGTYAGLPNPNFNRLTFLYAHTYVDNPANNHYHGIGVYSYSGPSDEPVVVPTSGGNRIPEVYTQLPPLVLVPGTGPFEGLLVSGNTTYSTSEQVYGNLQTASVQALAGYEAGTPQAILFHSTGGRWSGTLTGSDVELELVSKSGGLQIGTEAQPNLLNLPGDRISLGSGNEIDFTPLFWVSGDAPLGDYSAAFKLVDTAGVLGDSGIFNIDFRVIPEPSAVLLLTLGIAALRRR